MHKHKWVKAGTATATWQIICAQLVTEHKIMICLSCGKTKIKD